MLAATEEDKYNVISQKFYTPREEKENNYLKKILLIFRRDGLALHRRRFLRMKLRRLSCSSDIDQGTNARNA
jgi:hypothetical protein